ncbi:hypothetical protein J1N35_014077, partial [Gossypium stocksii]
ILDTINQIISQHKVMDDFYYMWFNKEFDYDEDITKKYQQQVETPALPQDNNDHDDMPSEMYQEVFSLKLSREESVIIDACEEELLHYYPLQQTEEYSNESNRTSEREDMELVEEMDNESKNQIDMELVVPKIS